ncbi:hypothetical protein [Novosphingobium sp.]|uniref:hypothetical protein n=1 Tax=Novosphingobium sp. TaxID=1874826 RepID=UPI0025DD6E98|nr:hypothetical protein [Novosphingobium sp.]
MNRFNPFRAVLLTLLSVALLILGQGASAQSANVRAITNIAQAYWTQAGKAYATVSNQVAFDVVQKPVTIDTFVNTPAGGQPLSFVPSMCGGAMLPIGNAANATIASASAVKANSLHIGDSFFFRVVDTAGNKNVNSVDSIEATLVTSSGDRETVTIFETGPNTGVFVGAVPTSAIPPSPSQGDCRLSVAVNDTIAIAVQGSDTVSPIASATLNVLVDPFGMVFDSEDGAAVNGARVSLVDAVTGAPVRVFAPDGVTVWPSIVTTGQTVTDAAGATYPMLSGEYRFPLVAPGQYRVVVQPVTPYTVPSTASAAQLATVTRPDGLPVTIIDASFGKPLTLTAFGPVRIDVPADRPPVAVGLVKTASRDRAQPGDVVFYTLTAKNLEAGHAKRGVVLTDQPSALLRLRKDSIRIDGVANPAAVTIAPDGRSLAIALGTIAAGGSKTVTYAMSVRPDATAGQALNKAIATDARGLTSVASAVVNIEDDGLAGRITLIGRITDGDCSYRGEHRGIPGVRVMLEDGSFAVTDAEGRYHFDGLVPGDHVAAALEATLPEGGKFTNCARSTRNAGSATSRFISGQGGSLAVADFYADVPAVAMDKVTRAFAKKLEYNFDFEHKNIALASPASTQVAKPAESAANGDRLPANLDDAARSDRSAAGSETDWLAMGDGSNGFLFPTIDHNPRAPAVRVVIRHRPAQKVELLADGKAVPKVAFDAVKRSATGGWAVSMWRGIPIEGDVVHLTAVIRNADGSEAERLTRDVHFATSAAEARIVAEQSHLIADGRTRPVLAIRLTDRNGRPVHAGVSGDFTMSAPYESAEALDAMQSRALSGLGRFAPRWTVKGDDGVALIELAPTLVSGPLQLDFKFTDNKQNGTQASQQQRLQSLEAWVVPGDQKWTLVGLAEGAAGKRTIADVMERTGRFDSDLGDHGRVAFYAKGRVLGSTLLTVAYDSAKQRDQQRLLGAIDPRAYYTVFADGSDRRLDAASRNKLYVRIESAKFTALFGDFETGFNQTQLARYQRTATGVKAEGRLGGVHAAAYATRVASAHHRDEIQGGGISGPYRLSSRAIIANSDTVVIEVRDRLRSEVIVDSRTLSRFIDYDIDLLAGTITFKQPILSRDSSLNPQFIVADYEIDQGVAGGQMNAGGRVDWTSANGKIRVGGTLLTDTGNGPRTGLGGLDLKARIARGTEVRAEVAASRSNGSTQSAWLVEAEHHDGKLDVLAYARSMDQGYGVGQTTGAEAGRRRYGVDTRYNLTESLSLTASGWLDQSLTDATRREALQIHGEYRTGRNSLRLGLATLRDHLIDGSTANSAVIDGGVTQRLLDGKLELDASTSIGLGKTDSIDLPSRHQLAARYTLSSRIKLIGSYEIAKGSAVNARTGRFGFEVTPWSGARIASSLGTQDIAEYGKRSFAAFGLAQSFNVSKKLSIDATVDSNHVISGISAASVINLQHPVASGGHLGDSGQIAEDFTALTLGATWRANRWTTSLRGEYRDGELAKRKGVTFGAIRQLGEGTIAGTGFTWTKARGIDGTASEIFNAALAFAHRPADGSVATLAKVEFRSDWVQNAVNGDAGASGVTALNVDGTARASRVIGSVSTNWSPRGSIHGDNGDEFVQRSEIGLFGAVRYNLDRYQGYDLAATALLGGIDAHIGIGERMEIGGTATVRTTLSDHVTQFAFGPTIGVVPARDVILTLGYNFSGFRDRDFAAARNTLKGVFATLKIKFDTSTLGFLGLAK